MAFMIPLYVGFIWTSLVSALVILSPQPILQTNAEPNSVSELSKNISADTETNASLFSLPSGGVLHHEYNTSQSNLNSSAGLAIYCDILVGDDLTVQMCEDALAHAVLGPDINLRTWGSREANHFDIGLPRRYMSSDGICAIQPSLLAGKTSATVAPRAAQQAAESVIRSCVGGNPSTGGQARNFGGDDNLVISVAQYDPSLWADNVGCFGTTTGGSGIVNGCNRLADQMDTSKERKHFGPRNLPHDYQTPYLITEANNPCYMMVTSHPSNLHSIVATWYELWEAAIMVNAMCIRAGKKGKFTIPSYDGEDQWLEIMVGELGTPGNNLTLPLTTV